MNFYIRYVLIKELINTDEEMFNKEDWFDKIKNIGVFILIGLPWVTTYIGLIKQILSQLYTPTSLIICIALQAIYIFAPNKYKPNEYLNLTLFIVFAIINYIFLYFYGYSFLVESGLVF